MNGIQDVGSTKAIVVEGILRDGSVGKYVEAEPTLGYRTLSIIFTPLSFNRVHQVKLYQGSISSQTLYSMFSVTNSPLPVKLPFKDINGNPINWHIVIVPDIYGGHPMGTVIAQANPSHQKKRWDFGYDTDTHITIEMQEIDIDKDLEDL